MIKQLLTICALTIGVISTTNAQTVPNGGFENWTTQQGNYDDPDNWMTLNLFSFFGAPLTVTADADAHSGSFAAKCETVTGDLDMNGTDDTLPATLMVGTIDPGTQETYSGMAINSRADSLIAWVKYQPTGTDGFAVSITMSRWNNGMTEMLGTGAYTSTATISGYTRIAVPITYAAAGIPDTAQIMFVSSMDTPSPGSALWVDDLEFVTNSTAGIADHDEQPALQIFPNPANQLLTVNVSKSTKIEVFNALGARVDALKASPTESNQLSTAAYKNGVYFLKTESGQMVRFVVQH